MQRFLTTTTAPPWSFTILDGQGNVIPNFTSATFTLTFKSVSTRQKIRGNGSFSGANGTTGTVTYTLASTDLASAYAVASAVPGIEQFEIYVESVVGSLIYDVVPAPVIEIQKI